MAWVGPSNLKICHIVSVKLCWFSSFVVQKNHLESLLRARISAKVLPPNFSTRICWGVPLVKVSTVHRRAHTHTHTQGTGGELVLVVFSQLWETLLGGKGFPWWCPLSGVCTLRSEGAGSDPVYFCPLTSEPLPFPYLIRHCCQLFFWSKQ